MTTLPPLRDGDSVSCPHGSEWLRTLGRWIIPGQPDGLALTDQTVRRWWQARTLPGSRFALVPRITPAGTGGPAPAPASGAAAACYRGPGRALQP